MGVSNGVEASGGGAKPNFYDTRAVFRGDMVKTSLVFPAFFLGVAEPPTLTEPAAAAKLLLPWERFVLFGVVADLDMMM